MAEEGITQQEYISALPGQGLPSTVPETAAYLDPHKIITSFKLEGPKGSAEIHLTRLETGEIEVVMDIWKETVAPVVSVHRTYNKALEIAAEHAYKLIGKGVIG